MVLCFAPDCSHTTETHNCRFLRTPADEKLFVKWEKLLRRDDRRLVKTSKVCSCHFPNGNRHELPSIYKHNSKRSSQLAESPRKAVALKRSKPTPQEDVVDPAIDLIDSEASEISIQHQELRTENRNLKLEVNQLKELLKRKQSLTISLIEPKLIKHYTGLNIEKFNCLFKLFESVQISYAKGWTVLNPCRKDQLLLTLMKLHCNFAFVDLGHRFNVSETTVSNIFSTWLDVMHNVLFKQLIAQRGIPSRQMNAKCLPQAFNSFKNCRIILDCTEFKVEMIGDLDILKDLYSGYKHAYTLKVLVGCAPNGVGTFCSSAYPGSRSDKDVVDHCKVLSQMVTGDLILADKGFLIQSLLPVGVHLNIPPFLQTPQFSEAEVLEKERIARARVHIERFIKRWREHKILKLIPAKLIQEATKIIQVTFALTGFNDPIIVEVADSFN